MDEFEDYEDYEEYEGGYEEYEAEVPVEGEGEAQEE